MPTWWQARAVVVLSNYVYHIITQKWYYFSFHLSQLDVPWLHLFRLSQNPSSTCPTVVLGT
jgi:hypothetical protein